MWISGHLPTQKISLQTWGRNFFFPFFFLELNYAGISLETCKENASQFSEIANFSDRIVLEGLKEIQAIY